MKGRGNYSDASKGEDDVECVITTGPAPARQGFHLLFQDPHIHAEPANDEITGMNGRVFTRCSEAVEKQGATMSFDVDVRADLRAAWERRGLKPSAWCS